MSKYRAAFGFRIQAWISKANNPDLVVKIIVRPGGLYWISCPAILTNPGEAAPVICHIRSKSKTAGACGRYSILTIIMITSFVPPWTPHCWAYPYCLLPFACGIPPSLTPSGFLSIRTRSSACVLTRGIVSHQNSVHLAFPARVEWIDLSSRLHKGSIKPEMHTAIRNYCPTDQVCCPIQC